MASATLGGASSAFFFLVRLALLIAFIAFLFFLPQLGAADMRELIMSTTPFAPTEMQLVCASYTICILLLMKTSEDRRNVLARE